MSDKKSLWMRYVEFDKIKDLLHIINEHNGRLRAKDLEEMGMKRGVLISESGKPMTHSPRYHYRKVIENLGLAYVKNHCYFIIESNSIRKRLLRIPFGNKIDKEGREFLLEKIVTNKDCYEYFFKVFVLDKNPTLDTIRKHGEPVRIIKDPKKCGGLTCLIGKFGQALELKNKDAIHAISWGIRRWVLDLGLMNEIVLDDIQGEKLIYPIAEFDGNIAFNELKEIIIEDPINQNVMFLYIPSFIKKVAENYRFSINDVKQFLLRLQMKYPEFITLVPTSSSFIDFKSRNAKRRERILDEYVRTEDKIISHLRLEKGLILNKNS